MHVSIDRACKSVNLSRSQWYYHSKKDDSEVIEKLQMFAEQYPTRGFDDYYGKIRNEGKKWNRKRVLWIYRSIKLTLRRKCKRRLPERIKQPLEQSTEPNSSYSMDFVSDSLSNGRKIRVLNIMDDCTREVLGCYADYSIPGYKVVMVLEDIIRERGCCPGQIRVDNGPEFLSFIFADWCKKQDITIQYIQPGKPMQNGYIERLNRTFREDVLDAYLFDNLEQLRVLCDRWSYDYNHLKPHSAHRGMVPAAAHILIAGERKNSNTPLS
jgi:putative transposase